MRELKVDFAGVSRPVCVPESEEDALWATNHLMAEPGIIALDTETTGFDMFADDFKVRLVQFGTRDYAYVFDVAKFGSEVAQLVDGLPRLVMHNAAYDIKCLVVGLGVGTVAGLWAKTVDTQILAHLVDPRQLSDGGAGHSLKGLAAAYIDDGAVHTQQALHMWAKELGIPKDDFWSLVPIDNQQYLEYAGADVILTSWVLDALKPLMIAGGFKRLSAYEHEVARVCTEIEVTGMLVDVPYLKGVGEVLLERAEAGRRIAAGYGVDNVNSTAQIATALIALGCLLEHKTPSGKWRVNGEVLEGIISAGGPAAVLAKAVMDAKQAGSFAAKYVDGVIAKVDATSKVHASIRSLGARTGRMSVSDPPLHQLPAADSEIRTGFVAAPGWVIGATDSDQVELRVLAALSGDRVMIDAINSGVDLHTLTAESAGVSRKIGKTANFLVVYGGGAAKLSATAGIPLSVAKRVLASFWTTYPGVKRYKNKLQSRCENGSRNLVTPTGRRLIMDRDRGYASLNHMIQSTARDVLGMGVLRADERGVTPNMLMLVHDEIIWTAREEDADRIAKVFKECLTFEDFLGSGVTLSAGSEVYGESWGAGYV